MRLARNENRPQIGSRPHGEPPGSIRLDSGLVAVFHHLALGVVNWLFVDLTKKPTPQVIDPHAPVNGRALLDYGDRRLARVSHHDRDRRRRAAGADSAKLHPVFTGLSWAQANLENR